MAITRYEPFGGLTQLQREMSRLFDDFPMRSLNGDRTVGISDWAPAIDIREDDSGYVVHADLPGIKPEDVEVSVERNVLTIRGSRTAQDESEKDNYRRTERVSGTFFRQFTLPEVVRQEDISAKYDHGVLEVVLPKGADAQPRRIEISN